MGIRMGLSLRIFGVSMVVFGLVMAVGAFTVTASERKRSEADMERAMLALRERLSLSLGEAMWDGNREFIEAMVRLELNDPRVKAIRIRDDLGAPYLGLGKGTDGSTVEFPPESPWLRMDAAENALFLSIARSGVTMGTAEILSDRAVLTASMNAAIVATISRYLALTLIGLIAIIVFVKLSVIDAIGSMASVVARFSQKEFHARVGGEALRRDELGELGRAFNRMASAIQEHSLDLEGLVRERTSMLIESEKMAFLGGLTAGIAHEINTPVGIGVTAASHLEERVRGIARSLEDGSLSKETLAEFLSETAETSAILMTNLRRTSDFVSSFKRMAVDQSSASERVIKVRAYVEEILFSLRPKLKHTKHLVRLDIEPDLTWTGDPGMLSQILTNLIVNSLAHAFPDGRAGHIDIGASIRDGRFVLDYADDGVGIPRENLSRIFQPFFTTGGGRGGTGLGLYIIQSLAAKLGGSVSCVSGTGNGARFTVALPVGIHPDGTEANS